MAQCLSKRLGRIDYSEESIVEFPAGLPAFEQERRFVMVERAETAPVIFLQSLETDSLCFLTLPAQVLRADYRVHIGVDERQLLGETVDQDLLVLALITLPDSGVPSANLMAPLIIHRRTRRACQTIQAGSGYSFEERVTIDGEETACS